MTYTTETIFKTLGDRGRAAFGGSGYWPLPTADAPGDWRVQEGELFPCYNGLHLCLAKQLPLWLAAEIYEAEIAPDADVLHHQEKIITNKARLVCQAEHWGPDTQRLLTLWGFRFAKTILQETFQETWAEIENLYRLVCTDTYLQREDTNDAYYLYKAWMMNMKNRADEIRFGFWPGTAVKTLAPGYKLWRTMRYCLRVIENSCSAGAVDYPLNGVKLTLQNLRDYAIEEGSNGNYQAFVRMTNEQSTTLLLILNGKGGELL